MEELGRERGRNGTVSEGGGELRREERGGTLESKTAIWVLHREVVRRKRLSTQQKGGNLV